MSFRYFTVNFSQLILKGNNILITPFSRKQRVFKDISEDYINRIKSLDGYDVYSKPFVWVNGDM